MTGYDRGSGRPMWPSVTGVSGERLSTQRAPLVNVATTQPMEIVCLDSLSLEPSFYIFTLFFTLTANVENIISRGGGVCDREATNPGSSSVHFNQ